MTLSHSVAAPRLPLRRQYVRPPAPLHFPVEEEVPETKRHRVLANLLFGIVERLFRSEALVACDQFVYWDPTDPKKRLAPDLAFRRGHRDGERLDSWKTWLLGAPEVGVEVVSRADESDRAFDEKLARYSQAGVLEVVRFDPEDVAQPLRLWDLHDGDLVERELGPPEALFCDALGLYWRVERDPELGQVLRLAEGSAGGALIPTPEEAERAAKEAERAAKEVALRERDQALARIAELEAELLKR